MHSLHQAVEKDVKNKLEVLFEQWRDDAVGQGVPWMKAGDVIRAMKKTLDTCEREKRGEVKALPDGRNVVAQDGTQGELYLNQSAPTTELLPQRERQPTPCVLCYRCEQNHGQKSWTFR